MLPPIRLSVRNQADFSDGLRQGGLMEMLTMADFN